MTARYPDRRALAATAGLGMASTPRSRPPVPGPPSLPSTPIGRDGLLPPPEPSGRSSLHPCRPACDHSLVQVSVGSQCPECLKAARPATSDAKDVVGLSGARPNLMTMSLIMANVRRVPPRPHLQPRTRCTDGQRHRHAPPTGPQQGHPGAPNGLAERRRWPVHDRAQRLVPADHFGLPALADISGSKYFLYVLGPILEPALGRVRFLLLYIASMLGGALGVVLIDTAGISAGHRPVRCSACRGRDGRTVARGVNPFTTGMGAALLLDLRSYVVAIPGISIGGRLGGASASAICRRRDARPIVPGLPEMVTYATPGHRRGRQCDRHGDDPVNSV